MAVVARDDDETPGELGLVKQGGQDRYRIAGPAGIELFPLQQLIVDGIDDDADNASVRRCDLLPNLPREHGVLLAAKGRLVEDDRGKAALGVGSGARGVRRNPAARRPTLPASVDRTGGSSAKPR